MYNFERILQRQMNVSRVHCVYFQFILYAAVF